MTKLKIQQLNLQTNLSSTEQQQIYGGKIAESILSQYSAGKSNISVSDNIVNFKDNNGNPSGAIVHKNDSSFYIKNGIVEKVDGGQVTDSIDLNFAFLL